MDPNGYVAGDGVFSIWKDGNITLFDLKTNETRNLVAQSDVKDEFGRELYWGKWKLSPDMKFLLLKADYQKVSLPYVFPLKAYA
jgi:dipeptidyl aminopeptidase B